MTAMLPPEGNGPRYSADPAAATLERGPRHAATPTKRWGWLNKILPIVLVLVGIGVLLYPVAATNFNNMKQQQFAETYQKKVDEAAPGQLSEQLLAARAYNATLDGVPILDPWLTRVAKEPESGPYVAYKDQLSQFDAMARVRVPTAKINLPVYHGTTEESLTAGAGHLYGTALPVGGDGTHAVLTSHTAFANATLFDHLTDVKEGDVMYIDVYGETLAYQVDQIKVVLPSEIADLHAEPGKDLLTLFTCTPYAVNTHRLLVRGHRIPYVPAVDKTKDAVLPGFVMEPWMYRMIGAAAASLVVLGVLIALNIRRRRRQRLAAGATHRDGERASQHTADPPARPRRAAPD